MTNFSGREWVIKAAVGTVFTFSTITLISVAAASAATIPIPGLCNTGLDAGCSGLALVGVTDPTWTLALPSPSFGSGSGFPPPASLPLLSFPVGSAFVNTPNSAWALNGPASQWITPNVTNSVGGLYFYQDTFTIPMGYNPATAAISGVWTSDNEGLAVYLNGSMLMSGVTFPGPLDFAIFPAAPFTINGTNGLFNVGSNTLTFLVRNRGVGGIDSIPTDTGLRVEFNSAVVSAPEPSSIALLVAALAGFGWVRRRNGHASR